MKDYNQIVVEEIMPKINEMIFNMRTTLSLPNAYNIKQESIDGVNDTYKKEFECINLALINYLRDTFNYYKNLDEKTLEVILDYRFGRK